MDEAKIQSALDMIDAVMDILSYIKEREKIFFEEWERKNSNSRACEACGKAAIAVENVSRDCV